MFLEGGISVIDVSTYMLENGIEYTEIDNLEYNNNKYILLSNINNVKDSCIRKLVIEDNEEYIYRLEDDKEFDVVLNLFIEKNKALFS